MDNKANELTRFNVNDGPFTEFKYDDNGNRVAKIEPGNRITSYSHDLENRLTKVQFHQDKWVGFEYDGDGNRITKLSAMTQPQHDQGKGNDPGFIPPGQEKVKKQQAELINVLLAKGGGGGSGGGGNSGGNSGNKGGNSQGKVAVTSLITAKAVISRRTKISPKPTGRRKRADQSQKRLPPEGEIYQPW
ncbi:MAG: RHS repeat protein [Clostridia bacterium]|nr:RHS repeat protein [Clostridia bacterium]